MELQKLIIENFKSFQNRTEIDFTRGRKAQDRNVFLIGALNGVGKTSILEAINICLYGEKQNKIAEAINRHQVAKGNVFCYLEIQMKIDNNTVFNFKRSWSALKSSDSFNNLEEDFVVAINKKPLDVNDYTIKIILNAFLPPGITQFFFFDGEKIQYLAADEQSEQKLKDSMEAVLGITPYKQLIEDLKKIRRDEQSISSNNIDITEVKEKELELEQLKNEQEKHKNEDTELQERIKEIEQEREQREKEFESRFGFKPETLKKREQQQQRLGKITNEIDNYEQTIDDYTNKYLPLALLSQFFPQLHEQIEIAKQATQQLAVREESKELSETIVAEVKKFEEQRSYPLTQSEVEDVKQRILNVIANFNSNSDNSNIIKYIRQLSDNDRVKLSSKVYDIEREGVTNFKIKLAEIEERQQEKEFLEYELQKTQIKESDSDLKSDQEADIKNLLVLLGRTRERQRQLITELSDDKKKIGKCERDLEVLYKKNEASQGQKNFIGYINKLIELLSEYIEELRSTRISQLQQKTFEMYQKLSRKNNIASIRINEQDYTITITDTSGINILKENLSAGEKEVFAISLLWGLGQTSQLEIPIVIDTPMSRLDSEHRSNMVKHYYPKAGHQVIVLSTDEEIRDEYYEDLKPYLQHSITMNFNEEIKSTTIKDGYFDYSN